jgi:hypothetical protein
MNFLLAQSMVHRPRVLRGGNAPRVLKRELAGLTEQLGSMPRRCDWVREVVETQPHLLSGPLLGTCLAAVTATRVVSSEGDDEATDNRLSSPRPGFNRAKEIASKASGVSKRDQIRSPAVRSERSRDARQFETVSQLPRRASDSILRRAAPEHVNANQISGTVSMPHRQAVSPPVNSSPRITRSEWLNVVADRAAKKWIADWVLAPARKYSSPAVVSNHSEQSPLKVSANTQKGLESPSPWTVETNSLPLLNNDWLLPIGGQQASPQLLTSLVNRAHSDIPAPVRRSKETLSEIDSQSRSFSSAPDPLATRQQSFTDGPEPSRPLKFDRQSPSLPTNRNSSSPLAPAINSAAQEQRASPDLAPTVLTPDLLPLLPPPAAGFPPTAAAADATRRIAWRDEVEAHETDLSTLAAQMKRILDEEARRHGIDV